MAGQSLHCSVVAVWLLFLCGSSEGADVTFQLDGVQVQSHSVVYYDDISQPLNNNPNSLQCLTDNSDCCYGPTGGHWYFPDGTEVPGDSNAAVYRTRGGRDQPLAAVYLHRDRTLTGLGVAQHAGVGLYRCEIPTSGTHEDIGVAYVGVYARGGGSGTPTISDALQFTRDEEGINQPDDSPVFTLTCNSGGGPATTVTWKRDGTVVSEDSNHVMTRRLVGQSGPDYTSTLTVTGREDGLYTCTVTNDIGSADRQYQVEAAGPPTDFSAVQVDGTTTVMVSWTAPTSGATPTGYRIYYQATGDSTYTTVDMGPTATERLLQNLQEGFIYTIAIVARSDYVPSDLIDLTEIVIGFPPPTPNITSAVAQSPTSVRIVWAAQSGVDGYEIMFERVTGSQQVLCTDYEHSGTVTAGGSDTEYTLTDLQEYSVYTFSLVGAVHYPTGAKARSFSDSAELTSPQAAPTGPPLSVSCTSIEATTISIQWDEVECIERNGRIVGYTVWYGQVVSDVEESAVSNGTSYSITGLSPYTNYSIEVSAVNEDGHHGPRSAAVYHETLQDRPGPVVSLSATPYPTSLQLTWSAPPLPNGVITAYEVSHQLQGGVELGRVNTTDVRTTHTLTGLRPQTTYTVTVRAYTIAGSGEERSVTETTEAIAGVQNVRIVVVSDASVRVSWSPVFLPEITSYRVFYTPVPAARSSQWMNTTAASSPVLVSDLIPMSLYQFQVRAVAEIDGEEFLGNGSDLKMVATDAMLFQLRILAPTPCSDWVSVSTNEKLDNINSVISEVHSRTEGLCQCGLITESIANAAFECFLGSDGITFRAEIHATSEANTSQLTQYIETWVREGVTITVQGTRLRVDTKCPVTISSFDDPECEVDLVDPTDPDTPSSEDDNTITVAAIAGGAVLVVVILVILAIIACSLGARSRRRTQTISKDIMELPEVNAKCTAVNPYTISTANCDAYGAAALPVESPRPREPTPPPGETSYVPMMSSPAYIPVESPSEEEKQHVGPVYDYINQ